MSGGRLNKEKAQYWQMGWRSGSNYLTDPKLCIPSTKNT
jgi:hypothetical protein